MVAAAFSPSFHGKPTVRERMEALGWILVVCEDTLEAQWSRSTATSTYYQGDAAYRADLDRCQREFGYHDGESAYS